MSDATATTPRPAVKVKTTQAPFDTARPKGHLIPSDPPVVACSRVIPSDRPVIACSIPGCLNVVIPDGDAACTYRQLRAAARRRKWSKDDLGLDCCPAHPKGRVSEPVEPAPAMPVPVEPEMLDGEVVQWTTRSPPAPIDPAPTSTLPVIEAWMARPGDDVWDTYADNIEATQEITLSRFMAAHDEQAAHEGPSPLDDEPDESAGDGEDGGTP